MENIELSSEPSNVNDAFKKWFGDSKVIDTEGKPLVVYHGTNHKFDFFLKNKMVEGRLGKGFYFTSSKEEASNHGKNIIAAYLKIDELYNGRTMKTIGKGKFFGIEYTISNKGGRVFMVDNVAQIKIKPKMFKDGGTIKSNHSSLGSASELGITPKITGHDLIAECGDCGDKFSYQKVKSNILWECPNCLSKNHIS